MGSKAELHKSRILLIDDCEDIGYLVNVSLEAYKVDQVRSLAEARTLLADGAYDLLLIDVVLPDGDGFRFCRELAQDPRLGSVPKILLTAKQTTSDKVFGFNCGADDYIVKPFDTPELKARVEARLRSHDASQPHNFRLGQFEFDHEFQRCFLLEDGHRRNLGFTATEFRIFLAMARREGLPLSRTELVNLIWKNHGLNIEPRGINSHIRHLRMKLGLYSRVIISVYGKGYALQLANVSESAAV